MAGAHSSRSSFLRISSPAINSQRSGRRNHSGSVGGYGTMVLSLLILVVGPLCTLAFVSKDGMVTTRPPGINSNRSPAFLPPQQPFPSAAGARQVGSTQSGSSSTQLNMFMGSDGGILGIGTPELFTILLVGYFVLGPSDLYKLTKEIGKFVQNFRTFTADATASLENNFESQLQLEEIRKAQRELNDAFSFRRSINVDADTNPFEVNAQTPRSDDYYVEPTVGADVPVDMGSGAVAATATATAETTKAAPKKKIRRRRVKKQVVVAEEDEDEDEEPFCVPTGGDSTKSLANNVPDLSIDDDAEKLWASEESADRALREANEQLRKEAMEEEAAQRRKERMERLEAAVPDEDEMQAASARFQAQLSGNWNDSILAKKEEELSPLASIMERLALLEEEKQAADERLQEEFRLREENEERFYRQKRELLEEAAAQIQADIYAKPNGGDKVPAATTKATESSNTTTVAKA